MRSSRSIAAPVVLCALGSSLAFTFSPNHVAAFTFPPNRAATTAAARSNCVRLHSEKEGARPTPGMGTDESSEYEFNEDDFADYTSDYSDVDYDDGDVDYLGGDAGLLDLDLYEDYSDIGGFDLSPFEKHAREVFLTYAAPIQSTLDLESEDLTPSEEERESEELTLANAAILKKDLYSMLQELDVPASKEESKTLFKYLDRDDNGFVTLEEFLPWYAEAVDAAQQVSLSFQDLVRGRREVHKFDDTEVDDGVLRRALECAIAAPNRRGTEPWRFIKLGKETVGKITELREELHKKRNDGEAGGVGGSFVSWAEVPHWIVVTYERAPPDSGPDGRMQQREDFKSACCAVQNFLLSMWSEGIGTKWTDGPIQRTEEFAEICGIDAEREKVAGVIWYGFAKGGLNRVKAPTRRKGVEEVLDILP